MKKSTALPTFQACIYLGVSYWQLMGAVRDGSIIPPSQRDSRNSYLWTAKDLRRAKWVLTRRCR